MRFHDGIFLNSVTPQKAPATWAAAFVPLSSRKQKGYNRKRVRQSVSTLPFCCSCRPLSVICFFAFYFGEQRELPPPSPPSKYVRIHPVAIGRATPIGGFGWRADPTHFRSPPSSGSDQLPEFIGGFCHFCEKSVRKIQKRIS